MSVGLVLEVSVAKKLRRGVVIRVDEKGARFLMYGSSQEHTSLARIVVNPGDREAKALGFRERTFFYARSFAVIQPHVRLTRVNAFCPASFLVRLQKLFEEEKAREAAEALKQADPAASHAPKAGPGVKK